MDYAVKITRHSVECSEADIEGLRSHGLSDEDIYDVINKVDDLDSTDFLLITPDGPVVSVEIACTGDNDFEVTLINADGTKGELAERIEVHNWPADVHIQHYNGFDKSAYYEHDDD